MALSAFYIHKRSVDQVLRRLIQIRRTSKSHQNNVVHHEDDDDQYVDGDFNFNSSDGGGGDAVNVNDRSRSFSRSLDEAAANQRSYRMSSSLPNVAVNSEWFEDDVVTCEPSMTVSYEAQARASSLDNLDFVASGLPPLTMNQADSMVYSLLNDFDMMI